MTIADQLARIVASPPPALLTLRKMVGWLLPLLLASYAIYWDQFFDVSHAVPFGWRIAAYVAAAVSLFAYDRVPYIVVVIALACWITTGSAVFVIATSYLTGRTLPRVWWGYLIVLAVAHPLGIVPAPQIYASGNSLLVEAAVPITSVILPAFVGLFVRITAGASQLRRQRYQAEAEAAEARANAAVAQDRLRTSREMHDIIGQRLSLIILHATALAASTKDDDSRTLATKIATSGNETIKDLHYVLGLLRQPEASSRIHAASIEESVSKAREEGISIEYVPKEARDIEKLVPEVRALVESTVSESLHNAVKHAPGASASISFTNRPPDEIRLRIYNGPAATTRQSPPPSGGYGLAALAERAAEMHGVLRAEPSEEGGYLVELQVPVR